MKTLKIYIMVLLCILLWIFLQGCNWQSYAPVQYIVKSDRILLEWNPHHPSLYNLDLSVKEYRIYYRIHGLKNWIQLGEIAATDNPSYQVNHSRLGNGAFDFGVTVLYEDGTESSLHSSMDDSAEPMVGWYILWIKTE